MPCANKAGPAKVGEQTECLVSSDCEGDGDKLSRHDGWELPTFALRQRGIERWIPRHTIEGRCKNS